jgi:hypothetical protein
MTTRARPQPWRVLLPALVFATFLQSQSLADANKQGEPFNTFRSLDAKLSLLDAQFSQLRGEVEKVSKVHNRKRRAQSFKQLRNSKNSRQIRSTVSSISTTVRGLASSKAMRKSRYGKTLMRALTRRATSMKRSLHEVMVATTSKQANTELRSFSTALLGFVLQFQALSGGYGALQCEPGEWTCCGRKKVRTTGRAALNGCMWLCVKRPKACRSGCLGPRTPVAVRRPQTNQERKPMATPLPRFP